MRHFVALILLSLFPWTTWAQWMPTTTVALDKYSLECKTKALKTMGWQLQDGTRMQIAPAGACTAATVKELAPQLTLPADSKAQLAAVDSAFWSPAMSCIFQLNYNAAAQRALKNLKTNHTYIFSPFWVKDQDKFRLWSLKKNWQSVSCGEVDENGQYGLCMQPKVGSVSAAIDELYHGLFFTDCGLGAQMAEYAAAKELWGSQRFDEEFPAQEIVVGDWDDIVTTNSFTYGKNAAVKPGSKDQLEYAKSGFQTFIGLSGAIFSDPGNDQSHVLYNTTNRNENFIVGKSTAAAAASFLQHAGLPYFNSQLALVQSVIANVTSEELVVLENVALQNQLGQMTELRLQQQLPPNSGVLVSPGAMQLVAILKDPFLSETQIYVHPFGLRNFAWHILRLAQLNPKMPYGIEFYADTLHQEIFDRWIRSQLEHCE